MIIIYKTAYPSAFISLLYLCTKGQPLKMIVEQFSAGVQKAPWKVCLHSNEMHDTFWLSTSTQMSYTITRFQAPHCTDVTG